MRADRTIGFIEPMACHRFRSGHDWRRWSVCRQGPLPSFSTRARGPSLERVASDVCQDRGWDLLAANAMTNRSLRRGARRLWSRHASTVYLWTVRARDQAVHYVIYGQDHEPRAV